MSDKKRLKRSVPVVLTSEDRIRLSELCKIFTEGGIVLSSEWNEAGAKALADGIREMYDCTEKFAIIKLAIDNIPKGKPDWKWITTTAYNILTAEIDPAKTARVNVICHRLGGRPLFDRVKTAIVMEGYR